MEAVATIFFFLYGRIIRKINFLVLEIILLHFFVVIKEMVVGGATFDSLYNLSPKVIITELGLDSYTTCRFHKYGCLNNTSQISVGATSHSTSSVKGLML